MSFSSGRRILTDTCLPAPSMLYVLLCGEPAVVK